MELIKNKLEPYWTICLIVCIMLLGCDKTQPTVAPEQTNYNMVTLRALEPGIIPNGYTINAVVISNSLIEDDNLVYVQDEQGGTAVKIRFLQKHNFKIGDKLQLYISGCELSLKDSEYEIKNVPLIFSNRISSGSVSPRITSAEEANAKFEEWSSSLVSLKSMKLVDRQNDEIYAVKDSIGASTILISIDESLNISSLPDEIHFITGYLFKLGGTTALRIRNAADIVTYSPVVGGSTVLESFDVGGEGSYASGDKVFTGFVSGDWMFNEASVLGVNEVNDLRNGAGSVRLRGKTAGGGYIYTLFDIKGLKKIRFLFGGAKLGEGGDEVQEYSQETFVSKDGGITWTSLGKKIGKKGEFTLMEYEVNGDKNENYRVKIQNTSFLRSTGNRIRANVDDVELIN